MNNNNHAPSVENPSHNATFAGAEEAYRTWPSLNNTFHLILLGLHCLFGADRMPDSVIWMMEAPDAPVNYVVVARGIAEWVRNEAMARDRILAIPEPEETDEASPPTTPEA